MLRSRTLPARPRAKSSSCSRLRYTLRALDEGNQQIVLAGTQRNGDAVIAKEFTCTGVQLPAVKTVVPGMARRTRSRHIDSAPPQHSHDARDELAAPKRFRQVIVGADFQADNPIHLVAFGGEHDDGDVRFGAKRAAQRETILARQHEIEEDEVDSTVSQDFAHDAAVRRRADPEALLGQRARNQIANLAVVVDETSAQSEISQPARSSEGEAVAMVQPGERGDQVPPANKGTRVLDRGEIKLLMRQGEQFIASGDVVTARILFQRAAEAGDADAAVALGATYDPIVFANLGVAGLGANVEKARIWYQKAESLGSTEATRRLAILANR
jgi:hypothetical protein